MHHYNVVRQAGLTGRLDRLRTHTLVRQVVILFIAGPNRQNIVSARQRVSAFHSWSMLFPLDKAEVQRE